MSDSDKNRQHSGEEDEIDFNEAVPNDNSDDSDSEEENARRRRKKKAAANASSSGSSKRTVNKSSSSSTTTTSYLSRFLSSLKFIELLIFCVLMLQGLTLFVTYHNSLTNEYNLKELNTRVDGLRKENGQISTLLEEMAGRMKKMEETRRTPSEEEMLINASKQAV